MKYSKLKKGSGYYHHIDGKFVYLGVHNGTLIGDDDVTIYQIDNSGVPMVKYFQHHFIKSWDPIENVTIDQSYRGEVVTVEEMREIKLNIIKDVY